MRFYQIVAAFLFCAGSLFAQGSMENVLRSVEANNKDLQANAQLIQSRKLEARLDNNLPDPSVSYSHQWGNKEGLGTQGELIASQSFDFPTVYVQKHKLSKAKEAGLDRESAAYRQSILLKAKNVCLDLILLNQQKTILDERMRISERLSALFATRLAEGEANVLETNKVQLELLNAKTEARLNESARLVKLQELAVLNGGIEIPFNDTEYAPTPDILSYEDLRDEVLDRDFRLLSLRSEQVTAARQVSVNRSQWLPGFELGYRLNTAVGGERFNGILVGITIPLFANRNHVKQAKAQALFTEMQLDNEAMAVETEFLELFNQAKALKTSLDEYEQVLKGTDNLALLNKAIEADQISMIEYFVNVTTYYESMQNYLQLRNQYEKVMAELYKQRL